MMKMHDYLVGLGAQLSDWGVQTIQFGDEKPSGPELGAKARALRAFALQLRTLPLWNHEAAEKLRAQVPMLLVGVDWRSAQAMADAGLHAQCGQLYAQTAGENRDHPRVDSLLYSAANCYRAAELNESARSMLQQLLADHPHSEHRADVIRILASIDGQGVRSK